MHVEQLQRGVLSGTDESPERSASQGKVAILIESPTARRLLEGLLLQLDLEPLLLLGATPDTDMLAACELVVADLGIAEQVRATLQGREKYADAITPAIIAVCQHNLAPLAFVRPGEGEKPHGFATMLTLPEDPPIILAQLSVTL